MDYRFLLVVPISLLLFAAVILISHYQTKGEWFEKSIELKGGTLISMKLEKDIDKGIEKNLRSEFGAEIRKLSGISGKSLLIEVDDEHKAKDIIKRLSGFYVGEPSIQTVGPALGKGFWHQAQIAIIIAFAFMGAIVFAIFRKSLPAFYVIAAAASDIIVTLAFMQLIGIKLSLAALAALLMLIGYSIDTDIMLTARLTKEEGKIDEKLRNALRTGLTMTGTTMAALFALWIFGISEVLSQIASVLLIGLGVDIINTWLQNAVLLRWHLGG